MPASLSAQMQLGRPQHSLRPVSSHRIGSVPHRFWRRPPSAVAMTTRISFGRGASATDTVIVSKCGKDQESSLCTSGTSRRAPTAATFVRRDHSLAAADRGPHRLAEHRAHASAAVLHFAVDPDDCTLAVGDGRRRTFEQLDELGMRRSPSSAPASNSGRRYRRSVRRRGSGSPPYRVRAQLATTL